VPEPKEGGGIIKKGFGFLKKLSKNEQRHRNYMSTKSIKLPKNFAAMVLDQELKIESGVYDIEAVNTLL